MQATLAVSERRACRVVGQCRATQQYVPVRSDEEEALRARIVALAREYGRYGYRRITALLAQAHPRFADGRRYFLLNVQAHYATTPELVEGGQLVLLVSPAAPK